MAPTHSSPAKHIVMVPIGAFGHIVPHISLAKLLSGRHQISFLLPENYAREVYKKGLLPDPSTLKENKPSSTEKLATNYSNIRLIMLKSTQEKEINAAVDPKLFLDAIIEMVESIEVALAEATEKYSWNTGVVHQPSSNPHEWWPQKPTAFTCDLFFTCGLQHVKNKFPWSPTVDVYAFIPIEIHQLSKLLQMFQDAKALDNVNEIPLTREDVKDFDSKEFFKPLSSSDPKKPPTLPRPMIELFARNIKVIPKMKGLLLDTFSELDSEAAEEFRKIKVLEKVPVKLIGPLCGWNMFVEVPKLKSESNGNNLFTWLDKQKPRSVLYVSFGSVAHLDKEQILVLESVLLKGKHPFVWSLRAPTQQHMVSESTQILRKKPDDNFIEVIGAPGGFISAWTPQQRLLVHPSIGGFISHCGWNSSQEAISAGIPVVAWPMFAEQHGNAEYLRSKGVGIVIPETAQFGRIVSAEEITKAINEIMPTNGNLTKYGQVAKKLAENAKATILPNGKSYLNLINFLEK